MAFTELIGIDTGELFTWGGGMYGKLGHGNEAGHALPTLVEALRFKKVIQVACGSRHTVALLGSSVMFDNFIFY